MLSINEWCARWHVPVTALAELLIGGTVHQSFDASEARVQASIRLDAPSVGVYLWRNNSGAAVDETGRHIRYGLGNDSKRINEVFKSADLIGVRSRDGRFVAIECKAPTWRFSANDKRDAAQARFLTTVRAAGGLAGFARSVDEFRLIVGS